MKVKTKIYLLQGNLFYSYIFKQNLHNMGYTDITSFNTIAECLNHLDDTPDVIFYDYDVDFMNGEEVLKMIKRFYPDIYLLFSCSPDESKVVQTFLRNGAFDYFIKGENEMKSVEDILQNIFHVKKQLRKKRLLNFSNLRSGNVFAN
jgi:DNA-binding NtrC family response regulator